MNRYDPWDPAVIADPYRTYAWLRDEARCYQADRGFFVLSRYDDVVAGLRDHRALSSADGVSLEGGAGGLLVGEDPPDHSRNRRVGSRAFTKPALARHRERIAGLCAGVVEAALTRGEVDALADLANPVAFEGLTGVLGIPADCAAEAFAMADAVFRSISDPNGAGAEEVQEIGASVWAHVDRAVEARKRSGAAGPGDVVDAVIAQSEPDDAGWRLDRLGRSLYVTALIGPGLETTRHLISNGIELISRFPDEWQRVRRGEVEPSAFTEEALRFEAPVQGFFRSAREGFAVGDAQIPVGARVLLLYGAANRDARAFSDPDEFRPARNPTDHLAFGSGIHFCLGAGLARLEATEFFAALARRVSRVEVVGNIKRGEMALLRGWDGLQVRLCS